MSLADAFRAGLDDLYREAGVSVTYTDKDANAVSLTAIVEYDLSSYGANVEVSKATATVSVRVTDMAEQPRRGETFTVGSATHRVISVLSSDDLEHTALVG